MRDAFLYTYHIRKAVWLSLLSRIGGGGTGGGPGAERGSRETRVSPIETLYHKTIFYFFVAHINRGKTAVFRL